MTHDFSLRSHVFEDSDPLREVKASKLSAWKEYWLSGSVAMAWSSPSLIPCPTPIANIVMPSFLALSASAAVSCLLLELPSVTTTAIFGTPGLWPKERNKWCYKISLGPCLWLTTKCNCLKTYKSPQLLMQEDCLKKKYIKIYWRLNWFGLFGIHHIHKNCHHAATTVKWASDNFKFHKKDLGFN